MTTPTLAETLAAEILSEFYGGTTDLDDISEAIAMSHAQAAIRALRTYCERDDVIERAASAFTGAYKPGRQNGARNAIAAALASLTGGDDGR